MLANIVKMMICVSAMPTVYGQACSSFEVNVTGATDNTLYQGSNLTLYCAHNAPGADYVRWTYHLPAINRLVDVYEVNPIALSGSAKSSFESEVDGEFVDRTNHSLTIINAEGKYADAIWTCYVTTPKCLGGKWSNQLQVNLTDTVFQEFRLQPGGVKDGQADVTCFAISDPVSKLSFIGLHTPETICVRVTALELWNCSITAIATENMDVSCTVTFRDTERTASVFVEVFPAKASTAEPGASTVAPGASTVAPGASTVEPAAGASTVAAHSTASTAGVDTMIAAMITLLSMVAAANGVGS